MTSSPTSSVDSPPSTSSQTADNLIDSEGAGQVVRPFFLSPIASGYITVSAIDSSKWPTAL